MKRIITTIIFIYYIFGPCLAQIQYLGHVVEYDSCSNCTNQNYQYGGEFLEFMTEEVISDFGPRFLSNATPYDFHGGVDYTITRPNTGPADDLGYHIVSIVGGTIIRLRNYVNPQSGVSNLKYIVIDGPGNNDYGYLHLFDNTAAPTTIGDMIYTRINSNQEGSVYGIYDISNEILYSDCNGGDCDSSFYFVYNNDTVYATNQVNGNDPIAILGTSGGVGSHLHLSKYNTLENIEDFVNNDENAVDPLEACRHEGPEYDVQILYRGEAQNLDEYPEGIDIQYPGINYTAILVRPIMPDMYNGQVNNGVLSNGNRYYIDNSLNIHRIDILIESSFLNSSRHIEGPFYESKFYLGARTGEATPYPAHIAVRNAGNVGNWNRTGIHPLAYKTNSPRRWDDYYFADFVTRIHKDDPMDGAQTNTMIAYTPHKARYPDGLYQLYAQVTDVRDSSFYSDTLSFELDNFAPFIDSVHLSVDGQTAYEASWQTTDNGLEVQFVQKDIDDVIIDQLTDEQLTLSVRTTEPVDSLRLQITEIGLARSVCAKIYTC